MNILVTGANRGIGLALASAYLQQGHQVFAATRNPDGARDLWELESQHPEKCQIIPLDVLDEATIVQAGQKIQAPIDVLINNAGICPEFGASLTEADMDTMARAFAVNTLGPIRVVRTFLNHLSRSKKPIIGNISSKVGSIADNQSGGAYAYRMSKTALNMFNRSFVREFPQIISVVLHPGWVQTDMGGPSAPTGVLDSADGLIKVIDSLGLPDSGRFIDFCGLDIPW